MSAGPDTATGTRHRTSPPAGDQRSRRRRTAWIPPQLRRPDLRAPFLRWAAIGAAIRLLLLPIAITSDTLAVYWRSHLIAFHGEVYSDYLVNMGSHAVHALWLLVAQPFLGPADQLWTHPWWWSDSFGLIPEHMTAFLARDDVWRAITLLKMPYLLAEVAAGLVLLWIVWGRSQGSGAPADAPTVRRSRRLWIFWMLSPAALYATLLFGRYEAFPVLAVVVALLLAERDRPWWAAIALGVAITLRTYPIVFVPVFALLLMRGLWRQVVWAGVAVAPFLASMAANKLVGGNLGEVAAVGDYDFGGNWFAFALQPERGGPGVYLFVATLLALGLYLLGRDRGWFGSAPIPREHLWVWVTLTHLAVFAFSQFSAHYLMWIVPAVGLLLGRTDHRGVVPLHLVQVGGVFLAVWVLYGGVLFTGTLGGLGPTAQTLLPHGPPLSAEGGQQVANIAWTAFWVATLALAFPLLRDALRSDPGTRVAQEQLTTP